MKSPGYAEIRIVIIVFHNDKHTRAPFEFFRIFPFFFFFHPENVITTWRLCDRSLVYILFFTNIVRAPGWWVARRIALSLTYIRQILLYALYNIHDIILQYRENIADVATNISRQNQRI